MDEQTKGFRSAVFGGFRREDVLRYIEETDARYYEESERLRSGLDDAQTAMGELRGQNEKLTEKNAELLERLGAMTLDMDRIQAQLDEIEKGFSLQTTEIEAQNERAETLAAENDRLTSENAKLAAKCGEYDQSKQIEEDAKTELQKLRRQSLETIEQVRRQLEETKENYRVMLARSQQESQEMARRAGEVIGEIDRISASLGKNTTEKSKNGLRDVLNSLRPKTEEN